MASSATTASSTSIPIKLEEIEEGEHVETTDYYFDRIGEPVPVKLHDSIFDPESPPSQPLAVSERFRLIFVAHLSGFCVARTDDVIASAKEIKDRGSGSSVQDLSIVDVSVGKVHILALSTDNSTLAAAVASDIYLFSVSSLLDKEPKPSSSCSLNDLSCIKDFKWTRKLENSYLVLSRHGQLCQGLASGSLKTVMHEVDAVEWSVKGKFIAVAKKDILSIFSCKFKERLAMSLLLNSGYGDADTNLKVKVDSIKWVRTDCIILGCFQVSASGAVENYVVQVVRSRDGKITDACSNRVVLSFSDMHPGFTRDIMPVESGPCLFLSYLDKCKLAIVANRNNTDQHIVLLAWLLGDENEVAVVDIERDTSLPRIELQENGDDNLVMGLCVDRVSLPEKVKVQTGVEEMTEVSPYCVLLCLTLEGKLLLFHFSGVNETEVPPEIVTACDDEEEDTLLVPTDYDESQHFSESRKEFGAVSVGLKVQDMDNAAISSEIPMEKLPVSNGIKSSNINESPANHVSGRESNIKSLKVDPFIGSQSLRSSFLEKPSNEMGDFGKPVQQFTGGSNAAAFVGSSGEALHQSFHEMKDSAKRMVSTGLQGASELSSDKPLFLNRIDPISPFLPTNSLQSKKSEDFGLISGAANASTGVCRKPFQTHDAAGTLTQSVRQVTSGADKVESLPVIRGSHVSLQDNFSWGKSFNEKHDRPERNYSNAPQAKPMSSEQNLLKQFANMKEMSKELDMLLKSIEEPGGFWDACTSFQKSSVEAVELGLARLSDQCQLWRHIMNERVQKIQNLFDKTVEVLARKVYIEGIVKQASDSQYWELWDRQKLSSELELKQQHILKLDQDMTNQLIELERHFNGLELNKFGGNGESQVSDRSLRSKFGSSRDNHSLHSLNNIMGSQLAAAQLLSESLSKHMAALNIESPSLKRKSVTKELFETIGITYDTSFSSPNVNKITDRTSSKKHLLSADSLASKDSSRRKQWSGMKNYETETGRRRRDSLDRNLASFDPPKTTVTRMLLQGSHKASEHISLLDKKHSLSCTTEGATTAGPANCTTSSMFLSSSIENRASIYTRSPENVTENLATPSVWASLQQPSSISGQKSQALLKNSVPAPSPSPSLSSMYQSLREMQKKSSSEAYSATLDNFCPEVSYPEKSNSFDYLSLTRTDPVQKSDINLDQKSSITTMSSTQTPIVKKSIDASNLNSKKTDIMDRHTTVSPRFESANKPESAFVGTTSPLVPNFFGTSKEEEKSSPTSFSLSVPAPSLPFVTSSLNSSSSASTMNSGIPISKSLTSSANMDPNNALPTTVSKFSSPVVSVSGSLFQPPKMVSSISTLSSLNPMIDSSKKELPPLKSDGETEKHAPASQPESLQLKLHPSVTSADKVHVEPSFGSQTSSKDMELHAPNVTGNTQQKLSSAAHVSLPTPNVITSKNAAHDKNEAADVTITQDDSMDEEAPETTSNVEFSLSSLGGFGDSSPPMSSAPKPNPFGGPFGGVNVTSSSSTFTMAVPSGELFKPASFSFQSPLASQSSQPSNSVTFSGGFGSGLATQAPSQNGFGQPAQIGLGQQALGTVLGSFGQSRQLGPSLPGTSSGSPSGFGGGGFTGMKPVGGFTSAATGGGFTGVGSGSAGGFAGVGSGNAGGFAGVGSGNAGGFAGGRFPVAPSSGGGFAGGGFPVAPSSGGGFAGAAGGGLPAAGGFGAFSSQQKGGFGGGASGTGKPPELFTQMRK